VQEKITGGDVMDKMALLSEIQAMRKAMNAALDRMAEKITALESAPPPPTPQPQEEGIPQMVGVKYLAERFDVGKSTIEMWARNGVFPRGVLLFDQRARRWNLEEVKEWMAAHGLGEREGGMRDSKRKAGRKARVSTAS